MKKLNKLSKTTRNFFYFTFSIAFLLAIAFGCIEQADDMSETSQRPQGVPESAFWIGGADGGVFIVVQKNKELQAHIYYSEIYHDQTGELWYKGRLAMQPSDQPYVDHTKQELFMSWDGESLHLSDGRVLQAIDKQN